MSIITTDITNAAFEKAKRLSVVNETRKEAATIISNPTLTEQQTHSRLQDLKQKMIRVLDETVAKEKATYIERQRQVTKEGEEMPYMVDGLGQHMARIPTDIYMRLIRDPNMREIFKDRKLLHKFLQDNPEMKRRREGNC